MPDPADLAAPVEARHHAEALAAHYAARRPQPAAPDGLCVDCGDPIPPARLAARPDAARCVECQTIEDRR